MKQDKKIVIYGSGRYPKDFLYVFDSIEVSYYVEDEGQGEVRSFEALQKEEKGAVFVIICKYDERSARANLDWIGLKNGVDYTSAAALFYRLDFPIRKIAKERTVYVYGTGDVSHHFFHDFVEKNPDVEIAGCVDGDLEKRGKTFFRRPVYRPEEALENPNAFFIIASTRYYQEIKAVLLCHGKREGEDFVPSCAVNQWASWMMRETIYDVPRLDYICPKPFTDAALMGEGRLSVCAGVRDVENRNLPLFYGSFGEVWHSNIMKILRLSVLNGTYSFCDEQKCEWKRDCKRRMIDPDELHYSMHRTKEQITEIAQTKAYPKDTILHESNYRIREREYPEVVMCSFDGTCNLHCPSCRPAVYSADQRQRELLLGFTERLETELFPHIKRLKVAGDGEAFASNVYKKILFDPRERKTEQVGILSNGTLLTPDCFDKLAENYASVKIFISMDGAVKETAERLRAGADFERWKENMRYLGEKRKEGRLAFLAFNFVVQRDNYLEMPEYVDMCLGFHADGIKFSRLKKPVGCTEEEFERMSLFDERGRMKPELAKVVQDERLRRPEVFLFRWIDW